MFPLACYYLHDIDVYYREGKSCNLCSEIVVAMTTRRLCMRLITRMSTRDLVDVVEEFYVKDRMDLIRATT